VSGDLERKYPKKCACVHPDASRCLEWRNPPADPLDEPEYGREEQCECCCRAEDEFGCTEWDWIERPLP
jgi:hypothetical protein